MKIGNHGWNGLDRKFPKVFELWRFELDENMKDLEGSHEISAQGCFGADRT